MTTGSTTHGTGRRGSSGGAARSLGECWIDWVGATRPHHPARPPKPRPEASSDPRCAPRRADRRAYVAVLAQRGSRRRSPAPWRQQLATAATAPCPDHRGTERTHRARDLPREGEPVVRPLLRRLSGRGRVSRGDDRRRQRQHVRGWPDVPLTQALHVLPHDLGHAFAPGLYSINGGKMNGYNCVPLGEDMTGYTQHSRQSLPGYWAHAIGSSWPTTSSRRCSGPRSPSTCTRWRRSPT